MFYTQRDEDAQVVRPGVPGNEDPLVVPLATADVTAGNSANYKKSAVIIPAGQTVGVSHKDLEQTKALMEHQWRTGLDPRGYLRKGRLNIPFVNLERLHAILAAKMPGSAYTALAFTNRDNGKSGLKVGVKGLDHTTAAGITAQNQYSLLTNKDAGYAHLYYNFWAPFATFATMPKVEDVVVSDLFGNYVKQGSGALASTATFGAGNGFALAAGTALDSNKDGAMNMPRQAIGYIEDVDTIERVDLMDQVINPMWQHRSGRGISRWIDRGYGRVQGAETAGIKPTLSDFSAALLGGSNGVFYRAFMPTFNGRRKDIIFVIEELIYEGALGMLNIVFNKTTVDN